MRIGIDIDGVLMDSERSTLDYGSKFCYEHNLPQNIKIGEYDAEGTFGWTTKQAEKFWNESIIEYFTKYPPRAFAPEVIHQLKLEGNEIYIITARNEWGVPKEHVSKVQEYTKEWLKENHINYDAIIFTKGSKLPYCKENEIDIMIEDSPTNILEIAKEIPVICFHNTYNVQVEGENITRAYAWYHVYDKIKTIASSSSV